MPTPSTNLPQAQLVQLEYAAVHGPLSRSALACFVASLLLPVPLGIKLLLDHVLGMVTGEWQNFVLESSIVIPPFVCLTLCLFVLYRLGRTQRRGRPLAMAGAWISAVSAVVILPLMLFVV